MSSPEQALALREITASGLCIGCGACARLTGATMDMDAFRQIKPVGPTSVTARPHRELAAICPFSPTARNEDQISAARFPLAPQHDARLGRFDSAYVGAVAEGEFRSNGSSGGMVSWVAAELLKRGLVDGVAHVSPSGDGRFFAYGISRTGEALARGAKSRYYPVELSAVLDEIRRLPGRYAVVGVPCFIKAIHLARAAEPVLEERIAYTLGLFCGHMKSARLVDSFAWQMDVEPKTVRRPEYRIKGPERPANWYTAQLTLADGSVHQKDWWHLGDGDWGAGFFQNSACNWCDDVLAETADIAFGDAWVEPYSSDWRGTNVVIVRAPELRAIVDEAIAAKRLELHEVDADYIANTQAAGLRQRREGLGYRLSWRRTGLRPRKRVEPNNHIPARRKLIYRMRFSISKWSHRLSWLADRTGKPVLYVGWAHAALKLYHGLAYGRGRVGKLAKRLGLADGNG